MYIKKPMRKPIYLKPGFEKKHCEFLFDFNISPYNFTLPFLCIESKNIIIFIRKLWEE